VATTVVGGTVSVIGGGKFANGAAQAGFGYLFNHLGSSPEDSLTPHSGPGLRITLDDASNFAAGVGDTLSFNGTAKVRDWLGIGSVDSTSAAYSVGEVAGVGISTATGAGAGLRLAGSAGKGLEFSHWIPNRWGGPRSLLNGNFVTTAEHALSDPYRYRFMSRAWKALNPMPSVIIQQWNRIPWFWKGTAAGATYGGASAGSN
jgi:hypothetical protein